MKLLLLYAFVHLGIYLSMCASATNRGIVYEKGEKLKLLVHELWSVKAQVPLKYYDLPFCPFEGGSAPVEHGGLGQMLEGHLTQDSMYKLHVAEDVQNRVLCELHEDKSLNGAQLLLFSSAIDKDYEVHMSVDSLPAVSKKYFVTPQTENDPKNEPQAIYSQGFMLGYIDNDNIMINNHISIEIHLHSTATDGYNIVEFMVTPYSINHESLAKTGQWDSLDPDKTFNKDDCPPKILIKNGDPGKKNSQFPLTFTYDVKWVSTEVDWDSRLDVLMTIQNNDIQWRGNIHSFSIVIMLTGFVAMILARALRRDIQRYNAEDIEDAKEDFGWKLVHGDVFRPPRRMPTLFAVFVGTGVQLLATTLVFLVVGYTGFIPVARSGSTLTAVMVIFVFMGILSGYVSARIHRMFRGTHWLKTTVLASVLYPGLCLSIFTIINVAEKMFSSNSTASYFGPVFLVMLLWFSVQAPLVFIGSYYGFKREPRTDPVRTNQIPRQIPPQPWYMSLYFSIPLSGFLPFGAVLVELVFIMNELWLSEVYSIFGFLLAAGIILVLTCAEIAIVMCYFQLCAEDYCWWWKSLQWAGGCSFYFLLYSIFYQIVQLQIATPLGQFIYYGYCILIAVSFGLATSATGYFACYYFIRTIMASIKVS